MSGARELTVRLGGKWHRSYGTAPCPVCQPQGRRDQNALTLSEGSERLLAHCKRLGCGFRDILAAAGLTAGGYMPPDMATVAKREAERRAEVEKRAAQAHRLWQEAQPIGGTVAETYLHRRGIVCDLADVLRFHPECWHGATATRHPALVALVEGGDGFAVHRTYLRPDGAEKAAIKPDKAMLGAVAGGAVRLSDGAQGLAVAEGIETALSLSCGLLREPAIVWAALSTSGIRALRLPSKPGNLTVAPDGDTAGHAAAHALAERAHALGWKVCLLPAPEGRDWNDALTAEGGAA